MFSVRIDNQDPRIVYSAGWEAAGNPDEFNGTTTWTETTRQTATLRFTSSRISVYGTIPDLQLGDPPHSSYTIDGGTPITYTARQAADIQYMQPFYQSPQLSPGQHELVVTSTRTATTKVAQTAGTPINSDPPTTTSMGAATPPANGNISDNNTAFSSSKSSVPVGAMAGGVVGGVLVTALIVLLVLCRQRSRRKINISNVPGDGVDLAEEDPNPRPMGQIQPFTLPPLTHPASNISSSPIGASSADSPLSYTSRSTLPFKLVGYNLSPSSPSSDVASTTILQVHVNNPVSLDPPQSYSA